MRNSIRNQFAIIPVLFGCFPAAHAQWAVVDGPATAQLVQQVRVMQQAVQTAQNQLDRAERTLQSMTGTRGMQLLLAGVTRNYLPMNWTQLAAVGSGAGGYPSLTSAVADAVRVTTVLTPAQLSSLSSPAQQSLVAARQNSALRQALAQTALVNVSSRFADIQNLIDAIGRATDQKAILELQARIGAELGMLQNEQTKLQILQQSTLAQESLNLQREREQAVAGHGSFQTRFKPVL